MPIALKRAYEQPTSADGYRVLVDRLWPRGISKGEARIDQWLKDAAPSNELRQWFHKDRSRWGAFRKRYLAELAEHREQLRQLAQRARRSTVTLVFSATDAQRNNAVVMKQYLRMLGAP